jgi:hypothetical protein
MEKFVGIILLAAAVFLGFLFYKYAPDLIAGIRLQPVGISSEPKQEHLPASPPKEPPAPVVPTKPPVPTKPDIKISGVSSPGFFSKYSQITLRANLGDNQRVNITGWKIKSNTDFWIIPKGVEIYKTGADPEDIYVKNSDRVVIYSGANRLNSNYRLNKCLGYIRDVEPRHPSYCPAVDRSTIIGFSGACQDYIYSLGSCGIPSDNPPVPENDTACRAFLSGLNYYGCVDRHRGDSDFLNSEWRVWMASYGSSDRNIFDARHDRVQLLNREGELIDEYIY